MESENIKIHPGEKTSRDGRRTAVTMFHCDLIITQYGIFIYRQRPGGQAVEKALSLFSFRYSDFSIVIVFLKFSYKVFYHNFYFFNKIICAF